MSGAGLHLSSIANRNKGGIIHTDIVLSNHFFCTFINVRVAEMAPQNKIGTFARHRRPRGTCACAHGKLQVNQWPDLHLRPC
jgi:hypothetical protein